MEIKTMLISDIQVSKYNPRKKLQPSSVEYEKLKSSIEHFELVEPLVLNVRTNTLVSGHQRLKICKDLGYEKVDVVVVDLDDKHEKLLNLSLNKISGDWDYLKLHELFNDFELEDLKITGFDNDEIDNITSMFIESENDYSVDKPQEKEIKSASVNKKFKVYMSFNTKEKARKFLSDEGFSQDFKNNKKIIIIKMESATSEN